MCSLPSAVSVPTTQFLNIHFWQDDSYEQENQIRKLVNTFQKRNLCVKQTYAIDVPITPPPIITAWALSGSAPGLMVVADEKHEEFLALSLRQARNNI